MGDMDGAMALPALLPMEGWKPMVATPAKEKKHLTGLKLTTWRKGYQPFQTKQSNVYKSMTSSTLGK